MTKVFSLISVVGILGISSCAFNHSPQPNLLMREVKDIRSLQAEQSSNISELRAEVRKISGKVDELEYIVRGKTEKLQEVLAQVTSRVPPPEGVSEELLLEDAERISKNPSHAASLYRKGLGKLRSGDFKAAYLTFSNFIDQNPDNSFSDNARYWTGVCFEKMGQYDRAIVAYSEVYQKFPAEDRVPYALYRLAETLVKMGSPEDAKLSFEKLISDFPRHKISKQAKKRLRSL